MHTIFRAKWRNHKQLEIIHNYAWAAAVLDLLYLQGVPRPQGRSRHDQAYMTVFKRERQLVWIYTFLIIFIEMRQDQCKIEIVRHKPTPSSARRLSASQSTRAQTIRPRESANSKHTRTIEASCKLSEAICRPSLSAERSREGQNSCLNTIFHK